uniref:Uncharacterized protein n=1 Tax=Octopus bimaculoides TaxID=37653 RepID=A0A0L8FZW1_OCTBM
MIFVSYNFSLNTSYLSPNYTLAHLLSLKKYFLLKSLLVITICSMYMCGSVDAYTILTFMNFIIGDIKTVGLINNDLKFKKRKYV